MKRLLRQLSPAPVRALVLALLAVSGAPAAHGNAPLAAEAGGDVESLPARVRRDHPRLFLNREIVAGLQAGMTPEQQRYLADLRKRADSYPAAPRPDPANDARDSRNDWGRPAADAALAYLLTGENQYLAKATALLRASVEWYGLRYREGKAVSWYSSSRIAALCAFDWLYNDLSEVERRELGALLLAHIAQTQDPKVRPVDDGPSGPTYGFYGVPNLPWYAGIAFLGAGIDDDLAARLLRDGYRDHVTMLQFRSDMAGDDGSSATGCVAYAGAGEYQRQEYHFFRSWSAAVGGDIAARYPRLALFPNWLLWNAVPGPDGRILELGWGDTWHRDNRWWPSRRYLAQFPDFYRQIAPEMCAVAHALLARTGNDTVAIYREFLDNQNEQSVLPFLFTPRAEAAALPGGLPRARHFPSLGQIFMNSGWDEWATYGLFTAGGVTGNHKHYDENNFVIYRQGFLALDTGTRDHSGYESHISNYYHRTVAHNCVVIRMEGEQFPPHGWPVAKVPEANDGGMRQSLGAKVLAFETSPHFSYVASDATAAYHPDKCAQAVRQFVFLHPDLFIVFDRVSSRKRDQIKAWLLHTQGEPVVRKDGFEAVQDDGRLICRTLLPEACAVRKVGGDGKEFRCDGRDWPIHPDRAAEVRGGALYGRWRVEVEAANDDPEQRFLHVLQVGDRQELTSMVHSRLVRRGSLAGVALRDGALEAEVLFTEAGAVGGRIRLARGGRVLVDRPFTQEVQEQSSLAAAPTLQAVRGPKWASIRQGARDVEAQGETAGQEPFALRLDAGESPFDPGRLRVRVDGQDARAMARVRPVPDGRMADILLDTTAAVGASQPWEGARPLSRKLMVLYREPLSGGAAVFSRRLIIPSATPATGAVFLSDLKEKAWKALKGSYKWFNKDASHAGEPFALGAQTYRKGLMLAPPVDAGTVAFVEYLVPEAARGRSLRAVIGIARTAADRGSVVFRVKLAGDGGEWRQVYESPLLTGGGDVLELSVPLQGHSRLRIECDGCGDINSDHSVWADARLE